ncbi:MAG: hypothetical protein AB7Q23_15245 [Hyphomonadaceae bacterium]
MFRLLACVLAGCVLTAAPAMAGPYGCTQPGATTPADFVGTWRVRARDDGGAYDAWTDIAPIVLAADGSFSEVGFENGVAVGRWCVRGGVLLWGFDDSPRTTYRVVLSADAPMRGTLSFDSGGTGETEIRR